MKVCLFKPLQAEWGSTTAVKRVRCDKAALRRVTFERWFDMPQSCGSRDLSCHSSLSLSGWDYFQCPLAFNKCGEYIIFTLTKERRVETGLKNRLLNLLGLCFAFSALLTLSCSHAYTADAVNRDSAGLALKGYDVVAYFAQGKPVAGKKEFQYEWMGARWQFSSSANRDLFAANPDKYTPQYGGYCAYGVSEGHKAPIDPMVWKIVNGKLYLNYNADIGKQWRQ